MTQHDTPDNGTPVITTAQAAVRTFTPLQQERMYLALYGIASNGIDNPVAFARQVLSEIDSAPTASGNAELMPPVISNLRIEISGDGTIETIDDTEGGNAEGE